MNEEDKLIKVGDVAKLLGCSKATVWRAVNDKRVPEPVRIGGMTRWSKLEIDALITDAKGARGGSHGSEY